VLEIDVVMQLSSESFRDIDPGSNELGNTKNVSAIRPQLSANTTRHHYKLFGAWETLIGE
jgi:hypothetical protein